MAVSHHVVAVGLEVGSVLPVLALAVANEDECCEYK